MHRNYHEVTADTHRGLGCELGKKFGHLIRDSVPWFKRQRGWSHKFRKARACWPLVVEAFPQVADEIIGYASASRVSARDLFTIVVEDEYGCTSAIANNGKLLGHNEDWNASDKDEICVLRKTVGDTSILELFYYSGIGGNAVSINSHGVVQATNTLYHTDHRAVGIPRNILARRFSETNDPLTIYDELVRTKQSSGYAHSYLTPSVPLCMEYSATRQRLFAPGPTLLHTNHYLDSHLRKVCDGGHNSKLRRSKGIGLLSDGMSPADMKKLLRTRPIMNRNTLASVVVDSESRLAHIWLLRENSKGWVPYEY